MRYSQTKNNEIKALTKRLDELLPTVLKLTGYPSIQSLNGVYGGKNAEYIDIKNAVNEDPNEVPLLIPELRYGGINKKHEYRLDFTVINPFNMGKVSFELSPWCTHGELKGTKGKTQKKIMKKQGETLKKK